MRLPVVSQKASSSGRQSAMSAPCVRVGGAVAPGVAVELMVVDSPPERSAQRAKLRENGAAGAFLPISSTRRTSVQYIQISDTQTTPYSSMNALERMPVRSISAPNMFGSTKPPIPPARPTMPLTGPKSLPYSSLMYLKTLALPNAQAMPSTAISRVNAKTFRPTWNVIAPLTVTTERLVCGYDSRNRQIQLAHSTHQVTLCAPCRSDSQPPIARSTPPGSEKHAASSAAVRMSRPYSPT